MKRAAAISLLMLSLLMATWARADWRPVDNIASGPQDVWIADGGTSGGHFSLHSNTNVYRVSDDGTAIGIAYSTPAPTPKCTVIRNGRLQAYSLDQSLDEIGGSVGYSGLGIAGCRGTEQLTLGGYGLQGIDNSFLYTDAGEFGNAVAVRLGQGVSVPPATSARTVFGRDYTLIVRVADGWFLAENANSPVPPVMANPISLPGVSRTEIYGARDGGVRAIAVGGDAGLLLAYQAAQPGTIAVVEGFDLGTTTGHALRGVTLSELEGDEYGAGFGILLVESTGLANVWSAIPDPNAVGKHWQPSTSPPPLATTRGYDWARCLEGRYCAVGSSFSTGAGATKLQVYRNLSTPAVASPSFTIAEEETVDQLFTVTASDGDGDAVFVTWDGGTTWGTYLQKLQRESNDGKTWRVLPGNRNPLLCGQQRQSVPVDLVVSDGLRTHKSSNSGFIHVIHTPPGAPGPSQTINVQAGTGTVARTLTFDAGVCTANNLDFTGSTEAILPGASFMLGPPSVNVSFPLPRTLCDAGTNTYSIKVVEGQVTSDAGVLVFNVFPWGVPERALDGGQVDQDAGTTVTYGPAATHACDAPSTAFPGVDTSWTWFATGFTPAPPGVYLLDGGLLLQTGGVTPAVVVAAPECETGRIDFQATHTVRGANGLSGLDGGLTVRVFPTLGALSGALALTADAGPGVVFGTLGLGGVQCPSLRSISGNVEVYRRSDGGFVGSSSLPSVPGTYSVPVSGLCGGGLVEVRASALDTTGGVGPVTADVQMPVQPVGFTAASVNDFQIDCGDVARAQAAVTFDSTQCTSARIDWSSTGAVAIVPATGTPANLETVSSDFGGLIGMPVDVFATATAETGVDGGAAPRVLVRPARPPVTAVHVTDTAVASESRVFGVSVTLTNTTTCDVSSVEWHGWLDGLALVGTSVTGPDGGIEVVPDGGEFVVPGLSLPAGRSLTLRYSARPTLFGEPRPGGVAILRTVRVSEEGGLPAPRDTCGCQSASGAGTAALLGVLAAALLRKRRVRSRS